MRKPLTLTCALAALALAGCGSSGAPGVALAPSSGATAAPAVASAPASSSSTTSSATSTSTTPLPAALKTKPKVLPPSGPAPSKLVIKDLIKGTGPATTTGSTVTVQYVGVLYKGGQQFDASWDNGGQPLTQPLSSLIPGWQQGIPGMRVGGRRELIIPASLGYGAKGSPPKIPPNAALVFVIDLHALA